MLSTATNTNTAIRNYIILATSIMLVSVSMGNLFNNPSRVSQQDKLDNYSRYLSAGVVAYAQQGIR